ncbi:glycosyltransferase [Thermococcus sp. P6]|uniref:ArnT family glycosyltransferase n=1 Tax=Thermococcus sp. P6 TaxID=122420 RepID=UPI000B59DFE1|nr:glycosyltransferase family 39 protein [Thermococcus sp. P6]ASJ09993.1 glycosyltransferase [Thermococcus sp. P6]
MGENRKLALIPFIGALILGIATFPPWNTLTYDGALYIDIARNLARNVTDFTYQGVYMMYRPPLYPYTLSVPFRFTPLELHLTVARLVSLLSFALTALLVYLLVEETSNDRVRGIIASCFYVLNPLAFTMATRELVHSEFTLFYTLAVYLLYTGRKRKSTARIYLAFVSGGLAILTRYTGLSIIGVFLAYLWLVDDWEWVRRREYLLGFLLLGLTLAPWLYMGHLYYGGALRPFSVASKVVTLDRPVSAGEYVKMLLQDLGYLLPALAAVGFLRIKKDEEGWLLISWLFIGLAGIMAVTHKETRFITFLSPAIAVFASGGVFLLMEGLERAFKRYGVEVSPEGRIAAALLLTAFLIVPVGLRGMDLKEEWNSVGSVESEVLRYASEHYEADTLLVSPGLYTMAGLYYPDARIDMLLPEGRAGERVADGYYDLIILKNPEANLNLTGKYIRVGEFHGGTFEIFIKKEKG